MTEAEGWRMTEAKPAGAICGIPLCDSTDCCRRATIRMTTAAPVVWDSIGGYPDVRPRSHFWSCSEEHSARLAEALFRQRGTTIEGWERLQASSV